jgi:ABC-type multidrug transport system ATPase subunit
VRGLVESYSPTVLFTSHVFDETSRLCDRVGILHEGRLVHEGGAGDAAELRQIYFSETGGDSDL